LSVAFLSPVPVKRGPGRPKGSRNRSPRQPASPKASPEPVAETRSRALTAIIELCTTYERLSAVAEIRAHSTSRHYAVRTARDLIGRQLEAACEAYVSAVRGVP
jgi:hypothetical protein